MSDDFSFPEKIKEALGTRKNFDPVLVRNFTLAFIAQASIWKELGEDRYEFPRKLAALRKILPKLQATMKEFVDLLDTSSDAHKIDGDARFAIYCQTDNLSGARRPLAPPAMMEQVKPRFANSLV